MNIFYLSVFGLLLILAYMFKSFFIFLVGFKKRLDYNQDVIIFMLIFDKFMSFEWQFLEEVCDNFFSYDDKDFIAMFNRLFVEYPTTKKDQMIFIAAYLEKMIEGGWCTTELVRYSRATLQKEPYLFRTLPLWRKEECESMLRDYKGYPDDHGFLNDDSKDGQDTVIAVKDIGEVLIRIKKVPPKGPTKKAPENKIKNPFLRPSFNPM